MLTGARFRAPAPKNGAMAVSSVVALDDRTGSRGLTDDDELARWAVAQHFLRVSGVVVIDPERKLAQDALGI